MAERIEIGYVCRKGHFVFKGDPDDSCGTKNVGTLYAEVGEWATENEFAGYVDESLASVHGKVNYWRNG